MTDRKVKRSLVSLLLCALLLSGCGAQTGSKEAAATAAMPEPSAVPSAPAEATQAPDNPEPTDPGSNALVVWFSATGTTERIAMEIAAHCGADAYAIVPETPYTDADLDYGDSNSRTTVEQNDASARPAIAGALPDMAPYDTVFLGYPIWHGQAPRIICTFLEDCDMTGRTVVPFCTSGSSGVGSSAENLHSLAAGAIWMEGKRFPGNATSEEIAAWANGFVAAEALRTEPTPKTSASQATDHQAGGTTNMASNTITTNGGAEIALSALAHRTGEESAPDVYYVADITPEALMKIYAALSWSPTGRVAVKLSTGEPPDSNYLDPALMKDLVQSVNGTIVECNTAYGGSRASTAMHYQVAEDHGFTAIADFQILDENGSMSIPVTGGTRLTENFVGAAFADYNAYLILSHFKGHAMAGFGGAIKNISIGLGSAEGKSWIHSGGTSMTNPWGGAQDAFCEAMAEAGKAASDYLGDGERIVYINVMNRLSIDCDCDGHPAEPDIHDVGVLASTDPVALDQACVDLIWVSEGNESLVNRIENRDGLHTLEHAEKIGLGSRSYRLIDLDA